MDANGINMVAVGLEQLGAEEFVEGKFFEGGMTVDAKSKRRLGKISCSIFPEVYIDEGKKTYRDLNYRRFNIINIWKALLSSVSRAAGTESRRRRITGNLSGDGFQNGGLLIVSKQGMRVLLNYREEVPGDHVANDEILKVLGITEVHPSKLVDSL